MCHFYPKSNLSLLAKWHIQLSHSTDKNDFHLENKYLLLKITLLKIKLQACYLLLTSISSRALYALYLSLSITYNQTSL